MPDVSPSSSPSVEAKALLLGERLDLRGFEPADAFSQHPLAFRTGGGVCVLFRFGAAVFVGVTQEAQSQTLEALGPRIIDPAQPHEMETAALLADARADDGVAASGRLSLVDLSDDRLLIVADALAKSVALADDERYVAKVFERIDPLVQDLAATGGTALSSKALLKVLGEALVAQGRMIGRVEVQEKPDLLWDRPDLQRLHTKLADEYELDERARALSRKLKVVEESAATLAGVTSERRSLRLEIAIVGLIAFEIVLSLYALWSGAH